MSFVEKLVDFFSEEVKEIKENGFNHFSSARFHCRESEENLPEAISFVHKTINHYIGNTSESEILFKRGVEATINLDPLTQIPCVCLTRGKLSSVVTYFSMKDQDDNMLWFSFKNTYFTQWLKDKYGSAEKFNKLLQKFVRSETKRIQSHRQGNQRNLTALHNQPKKEMLLRLFKDYIYDVYPHTNDGSELDSFETTSFLGLSFDEDSALISSEVYNARHIYGIDLEVQALHLNILNDEFEIKFNPEMFLQDINKTIVNKISIGSTEKDEFHFKSYQERFKRLDFWDIDIFLSDRPFIPLAIHGNIMDFIDPMKVDVGLEIYLDNPKLDTRSVLHSYASDAAHPFHEILKTRTLDKTEIIVKSKKIDEDEIDEDEIDEDEIDEDEIDEDE